MLVTVDAGKHHLLGVRELLPDDVGRLLEDGMEHLTEATPDDGHGPPSQVRHHTC